MADYALHRLSSREFEHLVQALAVRVFGPAIGVFGDGPDGGREATFDRLVAYPSEIDPWDGYGVIQAKFLQRPHDTTRDGDWAISQLRDELQKYVETDRGLRQPDYFIYATNVVLTPAHGNGSKDRVVAVLEDFKKTRSLRDYAVWDHDEICRFLDAYKDVRDAYAGFITTGDVLARMMATLYPQPADLEDTLVNFLQKELLSDEFVNLGQAGHGAEERIPLAKVFVDLPTLDDSVPSHTPFVDDFDFLGRDEIDSYTTRHGFIKAILEASAERLDPASSGVPAMAQSLEPPSPQGVPGRFVLIGGPGQGKTTLGQFSCQIFRASIISKKPPHTWSAETRNVLSLIRDHCDTEDINVDVVPRFPFRLVLNDFALALSQSSTTHVNSVCTYLARQIMRRTDKNIAADDLRRFLAHYPSIIIFDGLDEVPASSNRSEVLDAIRDFWIDASTVSI